MLWMPGLLFYGVLSWVHLPASGRGLETARPLPWWLPSRGAKLQMARASPWLHTAAAPKNDRQMPSKCAKFKFKGKGFSYRVPHCLPLWFLRHLGGIRERRHRDVGQFAIGQVGEVCWIWKRRINLKISYYSWGPQLTTLRSLTLMYTLVLNLYTLWTV